MELLTAFGLTAATTTVALVGILKKVFPKLTTLPNNAVQLLIGVIAIVTHAAFVALGGGNPVDEISKVVSIGMLAGLQSIGMHKIAEHQFGMLK